MHENLHWRRPPASIEESNWIISSPNNRAFVSYTIMHWYARTRWPNLLLPLACFTHGTHCMDTHIASRQLIACSAWQRQKTDCVVAEMKDVRQSRIFVQHFCCGKNLSSLPFCSLMRLLTISALPIIISMAASLWREAPCASSSAVAATRCWSCWRQPPCSRCSTSPPDPTRRASPPSPFSRTRTSRPTWYSACQLIRRSLCGRLARVIPGPPMWPMRTAVRWASRLFPKERIMFPKPRDKFVIYPKRLQRCVHVSRRLYARKLVCLL